MIPMSGRQIAGKDFVELGSQKEEEFEMIRAHRRQDFEMIFNE